MEDPGIEKSRYDPSVGYFWLRILHYPPTVHFVIHDDSSLRNQHMASKIQIDRGDHGDSKAGMISGREVRSSWAVSQLVGLVLSTLAIKSSYVSKLSRPDGSYADTFRV